VHHLDSRAAHRFVRSAERLQNCGCERTILVNAELIAMDAFLVEFELSTSVILDRGINFAGLLARLIADRGDEDPLGSVPLAERDGIFFGSDLFVLGASTPYHVAYTRSLRPTAMEHDHALHDRRGKPMVRITLRDEWKNLLDRRTASSTATVVAFGTGDVAAVDALLRDVDHIGAKRSGGYGAVESVRVQAIGHPHAGIADRTGRPMRAVPATLWQQMNLPPQPLRNLVARLPRWASPYEPCAGPRDWSLDLDDYDRELEP
jgi:hypothetical protein